MGRFKLVVATISLFSNLVRAVEPAASPRVGPSGQSFSIDNVSSPPAGSSPVAAAGLDVELGGTNEVTLAVNPLNPLNVAVSSLFQYEISADGGGTWTAPQFNVVPAGYSRDGDPTLAFDGAGRLFYGYQGRFTASGGADEFVAELHPLTGAYLAGPFKVSVSGTTGSYNDKPWLAADPSLFGPYNGRLYMVWAEFAASVRILFSYSTDHGVTWSAPLALSTPFDGFPWPAHVAVAPNGDVFVSYHSQTGFFCNPDGVSGSIVLLRSTDGGVSFPQRTFAFAPGDADITYNVQDCGDGVIPNTDFWMQGSGQGWILPDPLNPGTLYVVTNDDPDDVHASGDDGNVYIVRSDDSGLNWSAPTRVDSGPGDSLQVYPTAAIDRWTGCIAVMWYDTRGGALNTNGNYFLDVRYAVSHDGGASFDPDIQINDVPFDPDRQAPIRFNGPPPTRRIGEYIGVALAGTVGGTDLYGVWTGNNTFGQQAITDSALDVCIGSTDPPPTIAWNTDPQSPARATRSVTVAVNPAVAAAGGPGTAAIQVRMIELQAPNPANAPCCPPQDFGMYEAGTCAAVGELNGCARWMGPPVEVRESQDNPALGTFRASRLQCTPYYTDWTTLGSVTVYGPEIMPSSMYELTAYGASCKGVEVGCTNTSPTVQASTRRYGDVATAWNPPSGSTQPDSSDVVAVLNKFRNLPGAPSKTVAQIQPSVVELNIDVGALDIVSAIDAFRGFAYLFTGPCSCPSLVTCNSISCSSPSVCSGGLCVRTCIGGTQANQPCLNNNHCPGGGTCSAGGFCRDRCGRCN